MDDISRNDTKQMLYGIKTITVTHDLLTHYKIQNEISSIVSNVLDGIVEKEFNVDDVHKIQIICDYICNHYCCYGDSDNINHSGRKSGMGLFHFFSGVKYGVTKYSEYSDVSIFDVIKACMFVGIRISEYRSRGEPILVADVLPKRMLTKVERK